MELLNRYGRVGEIFHALLEVAPSDEVRETITTVALGVFEDQVEEDATSDEAEIVRAILACRDKAADGKRLAVATITEEVNFGRGENEKLVPETVGWITNRLNFRKGRMPDSKGSRAILLDDSLLDHLATTYDIALSKDANTPQKPSDRQTIRKEGLFTLVPTGSDGSVPSRLESPETVREGASTLVSDGSDSLTVRGGDVRVDPALLRDFVVRTVLPQEEARIGYGAMEKILFLSGERFGSQATGLVPGVLTSLEKDGSILQVRPGFWKRVS